MTLHAYLTSLRESRSLGLAESARAARLDRSVLWRWENGQRRPDYDQLRALLDCYAGTAVERDEAERLRLLGVGL